MQKKKRINDHRRISLDNIINNLPIKYHLSESQNALINFSTTWNKWIQNNLSSDVQKLVALNSFRNGILTVCCINATAASQLKHLRVTLINTFNDAGHHEILDIKFEIEKKTAASKADFSTGSKSQHYKEEPRQTLSNEALDTLKHCEKGVKDEKLSASLKKLYDTLENLKKPNQ